jgi:uncharacterized protein with NRDE domain
MCLVSIAFRVHPDYPLILAGNRDEYHARPSAAADWWEDEPHILGGRDLQAGGTWLAVSKAAHLAVVTNRPELPAPDTDALSRGDLVSGALSPQRFGLDEVEAQHHRYGGFSLFVANRERLTVLTGGNGIGFTADRLQPGIYAISNTALDQPWPKTDWIRDRIQEVVARPEPDAGKLLDLLARRESVPAASSHGIPAKPFIVGDDYGTRCSTVVLIRADGSGEFHERRFGPGGIASGGSEYRLEPVS